MYPISTISLEEGGSYTVEDVNGFVWVRDPNSWGGYKLYYASFNKVVDLTPNIPGYDLGFTLSISNRTLTITNTRNSNLSLYFFYQSLPSVSY